jgi:hypothetical protein
VLSIVRSRHWRRFAILLLAIQASSAVATRRGFSEHRELYNKLHNACAILASRCNLRFVRSTEVLHRTVPACDETLMFRYWATVGGGLPSSLDARPIECQARGTGTTL